LIRPAADGLGVGAGAPPVDVDGALLLFYHERDADSRYTINVALLDDETGGLVSVLEQPILQPELSWERNGDVDDVVFVQGAIERPDGTVYLTYGAADRCVGAAEVEAAPLIGALRAAA
jgi:beta-1,2-mannobiose phosphorylase / 1,2-beta-oligomannan phosphorylase